MEEIYGELQILLDKIHTESIKAERLRRQADTATAWVIAHGEIVTKSEAAAILRVSRSTIYEMINRGDIKTSPDGRVLVRSMADWATGKKEKHTSDRL